VVVATNRRAIAPTKLRRVPTPRRAPTTRHLALILSPRAPTHRLRERRRLPHRATPVAAAPRAVAAAVVPPTEAEEAAAPTVAAAPTAAVATTNSQFGTRTQRPGSLRASGLFRNPCSLPTRPRKLALLNLFALDARVFHGNMTLVEYSERLGNQSLVCFLSVTISRRITTL
jgi:hypothetical protein